MDPEELLALIGAKTVAEAMRIVAQFNSFVSDVRGATGSVDLQAALVAVRGNADSSRQLLAVTEAASPAEAIGKVTAWKASAADADQVRAQLAADRKAKADADAKGLLDQLCASGRLEPSKRGEFEALYAQHGAAALTAAASVLPQATAKTPGAPSPTPAPAAAVSSLSAEEREVAKILGKSDEWMLAAKNESAKAQSADGKTFEIDAG